MIFVEFRLICGHKEESDRFLGWARWPTAPNAGECVNLDGEPYVVHSRGWACKTTASHVSRDTPVYCYIRVSPLQAPKAKK